MRIICDYCLTEYQVQPPPKSDSNDSRFSFRCSNCGRVFSAEHPAESSVEASELEDPSTSQEPAAEDKQEDILVRQGAQTYSAADMATIQKWIVERRLNREGLISLDGIAWTSLGEAEELLPFLALVERVQGYELSEAQREASQSSTPEPIHQSTPNTHFVDIAELESAVDLEPEDTQDELDIDPFPTEEVPLPPTPIVTNLRENLLKEAYEVPDTEDVDFDLPTQVDPAQATTDAYELPPEPSLPSLAHAQDMIDAPGPGFAENIPDFPTEEELSLAAEEEEEEDPIGQRLFASVESDWDEDDDDLAWVNDKKRSRRLIAASLLIILAGLTGKLILDKKAKNERIQANLAANVEDPEAQPPLEDASSRLEKEGEEKEGEEKEAAEPSTPAAASPAEPEAKKPPVQPRSSRQNRRKAAAPAAPEIQAERQQERAVIAREANARRGPQPKTAADFVDRGRQAISEGDYNAARIYYLDALEMEPNNPAANQGLGFAALRQGDNQFAVRYFCIALSLTTPTSSMARETQQELSNLNQKCP